MLDLLRVHNLPAISINAKQLEILLTPKEFYESLLKHIAAAERRITISTLYLGTGKLERCLVNHIEEALQSRNATAKKPLRVTFLLDALRGTRKCSMTTYYAGKASVTPCQYQKLPIEDEPESSCALLAPLTAYKQTEVALYHNPLLRGWLRWILPNRINEVVGVQHIKAYVFDDTVILSGANLSHEYFTSRQDRVWVIRDSPALADFYTGLVDTVSQFCYHLQPDGSLKPYSSHIDPVQSNFSSYVGQLRSAISSFLEVQAHKNALPETCTGTYVFPMIQCGPLNLKQEESTTKSILSRLTDDLEQVGSQLHCSLASGYFNLTQEYEQLLLKMVGQSNSVKFDFLCAGPTANGFLNSRGLTGFIPLAYREVLIGLLSKLKQVSMPSSVSVYEYAQTGWTFHAKGFWASSAKLGYTVTLVGSSNFSYRSLNRDLESQAVVWTNDELVSHQITGERDHLFASPNCSLVSIADLIGQPFYRLPWYLRRFLPLFRYFM